MFIEAFLFLEPRTLLLKYVDEPLGLPLTLIVESFIVRPKASIAVGLMCVVGFIFWGDDFSLSTVDIVNFTFDSVFFVAINLSVLSSSDGASLPFSVLFFF